MSDPVAVRDPARFAGPPAQFAAASTRHSIIERARLDDRFEAATGGVLRVLAPGGYGKSTLVGRWAARDERVVRWLDLEPIDNDPLVLGHSLAQALADLGPTDSPATAGDDIARLIAGCVEPFILVLDDVQYLAGEAAAAILDLIVENLPRSSTLVLAGRAHHHPTSIPRFRLEPGVTDVGTDDLAFDLAETEQMLTAMGVEPDIDELTGLTDQFEGWPAGLRLAGIVMNSRHPGFEVPINQLGSVEYITEYITEEWFGGLKMADQRLLMELGCLGRFSSDSCEAILGVADTATTLRRLCREETVLLALDQHGDWYRLHPLLQQWLCSRLRSQDRHRWSEIHRVAARWWEDKGDIDLAVEFASVGEQFDLCEELIAAHTPIYAVRGMHTTVERWLANLGADRMRASPRLCIVSAIISLDVGDGDAALHWIRVARQELERDDGAGERAGDRAVLEAEVLHTTIEPRPAAELLAPGSHAYQLLPAGPARGLAGIVLGVNRYLAGSPQAIATLREALFENDIGDWTIMNANAAAALAIVLDMEGERGEAAELCSKALRLLATRRVETYPATGITMAIASLIDARAGHHQRASERLALSLDRIDGLASCAPWYRVLGLVTLVRTSLLLDDARMAQDLLRQLERAMEIQDQSTPFASFVRELHGSVESAASMLSERSWSLTAAELRVAQYLPTNLSLADIATRLYVSRNTVKSHAASIYRKLGTSSRGEAVQRARSAGLIGETPPSV